MKIKDLLLAFFVVFIWGINFSVIKVGLEELPPLLFSALRFSIVAIPLVFFIPLPKVPIKSIIGVGVFLGILKFSFLFIAMKSDISAGIASLLLQLQIIFTIVLGILFLNESISKKQTIGVIIALFGFVFFIIFDTRNVTVIGLVFILLAGIFWATSNIIIKQLQKINIMHFIVWVGLIPPVPLFIASYFFESSEPINLILSIDSKSVFSVLFVGYIATLAGYSIWGYLLRNNASIVIAPFALLIPIFGIMFSNYLLDESLTFYEIIGTMIIMLGLIVIVINPRIFFILRRVKGLRNFK